MAFYTFSNNKQKIKIIVESDNLLQATKKLADVVKEAAISVEAFNHLDWRGFVRNSKKRGCNQ